MFKGEKMLIMCDTLRCDLEISDAWQERMEMAEEWQEKLSVISKEYGFEVAEGILFYEATGVNNGQLPENGRLDGRRVKIEEVLSEMDVVVAMTQYSATAPLTDIAKKGSRLRVASMPTVQKSMEETALSADYELVAKKCSVLTPKLTEAVGASIFFSTGHRLYLDLRNRMAQSDDGMCRKNKSRKFPTINLPSGESFIAPYEGGLERGLIGRSLTGGCIPVMINDELIVYFVKDNQIFEVEGSGPEAEKRKKYLAKDSGRRNITELGLGVNDEAVLSGNVLEDEKVGPHIGFERSDHLGGSHGVDNFENPENAGHYDIVYAKGCPIEIELLRLEYPDGTNEFIVVDGDYKESLFD